MTESDIVRRLRQAGSVFAEEEAALILHEARDDAHRDTMIARRVDGEPLEQIVGWAEFDGLRFVVEPGVFVPRHRTELLVAEAVGRGRAGGVVVDLCCGTGALGVAVRARLGDAELHASDIDPAEVHCAVRNVARYDAAIPGRVTQGDLFDPLPRALRGRVQLLLANAPYVPSGEISLMPPEARSHEHPIALDGGGDGLEVQRRVIREAPGWLGAGGHLLIETSSAQAGVAALLMQSAGLAAQVVDDDDATVVIGTRPAER
jgi:release factor glutamine methyltransferase